MRMLRKDPRGTPIGEAFRPYPSKNKVEWVQTENAPILKLMGEILEELKKLNAKK